MTKICLFLTGQTIYIMPFTSRGTRTHKWGNNYWICREKAVTLHRNLIQVALTISSAHDRSISVASHK